METEPVSGQPVYVVLGGGVATHFAVDTLRKDGFDGRITLISAEPVRPYDRPPLSKSFLQGQKQASDLFFQPETFYRERAIELLLGGRATGVDFDARRIALEGGPTVTYDKLLIATGATPIRLSQPGFDLLGVHYLRSLADGERLREDLDRARSVVVVGAGFIGSEVAASARTLGKEVSLIDLLPAPMLGAVGRELAAIYAEIHRAHGVHLRLGRRVSELRGGGRVEEAILDDGQRIGCDLVVVGVGVRPSVEPFTGTKLSIENGIMVDQFCATNIPDVYAAGDVANWWHPGIERRLRVEHFDNGALQGTAAAHAMAGRAEPYAPIPSFWSDQYETTMQYYGYPIPWDDVVIRGDPTTFSVTAFYLVGSKIVAAAMLNRSKEHRPARRLIAAGASVDPRVLTDPDTDLRELARGYQRNEK